MRSIDFTQQGGFPLTQDTLAWLQTAYTEVLEALGSLGGSAGPYIISGCEPTLPGNYAPGWIFYNGELLYFAGGGIAVLSYPNVAVASISSTGTGLTFNNGTAPQVMRLRTLVLGPGSNTTTASQFPWSTLKDFYTSFGLQGRDSAWKTINVNTGAGNGSITGTLTYKKNSITNVLQLQGQLIAGTPNDFSGPVSGGSLLTMGTLTSGYRPATTVPFSVNVLLNQPTDSAGTDYLRFFQAILETSGGVVINWIQPTATPAVPYSAVPFSVAFNLLLPLD